MTRIEGQEVPMGSDLLLASVEVAVRLRLAEMREPDWRQIVERAPELAQVIAEKGDVLQFRSKKRGETAKAFNALGEAIALLSCAVGGVKFLGHRWEAVVT